MGVQLIQYAHETSVLKEMYSKVPSSTFNIITNVRNA
jgi:hypothetical protein